MEVCIGSFYLVFFLLILMNNMLLFLAIKMTKGRLQELMTMWLIFEFAILLGIPLLLKMFEGVC